MKPVVNSTRCFGVSKEPEISEKRNIFGDLDSSPILKRKFSLLDKPPVWQSSSSFKDLIASDREKSVMLCNVEERDDISISSSTVDLTIEPDKLEDLDFNVNTVFNSHIQQDLSVQSSSNEKMKNILTRSNAFCTQ
jgi:hypothetical protein